MSPSSPSALLAAGLYLLTLFTIISGEDQATSETNYGFRLAENSYSQSSQSSGAASSSLFSSQSSKDDGTYSPGINAILNSDGFLSQMDKYNGGEAKYTPSGPVEAAVHTKKTIEVIPVKFEEPKGNGEPQVIEISPYETPLAIVFKTQTNKIQVNQEHKSETAEEVKETTSEEEATRVVHNVYRPVIQQINEIVQPIRELKQYVEPVIETMKTIISKAGPPDATGQQKTSSPSASAQSFFNPKPNADIIRFSNNVDDNRVSRFNELGTGQGYTSFAGSDMIKKYTSLAPSVAVSSVSQANSMTEDKRLSEMSRRYGFAEGRNKGTIGTTAVAGGGANNNDAKVEMIDVGSDGNYNDIIHGYISKLLESSKHGKQMAESQINASNIKVVSLPLKEARDKAGNSIEAPEKKKNFKILQEFRISIDNVNKKVKVIPVTSKTSPDTSRPSSPRVTYSPAGKAKSRREDYNYKHRSNNRRNGSGEPRHNRRDNGKGGNVHNVNRRFGLASSRRVHSFRRRLDNRNVFSRRSLVVDPIYSNYMNQKFANFQESRNAFNHVRAPFQWIR